MNFEMILVAIQWAGGILAYITLAIVLYGVWKGTRRQAGRIIGLGSTWLRSPWFYLVCTITYIGLAILGWTPLALVQDLSTRAWMLVLGSLLFFPGMAFLLWGRIALGKNYFVSTGFGAQLFSGHQLVISGPYALVRHPVYSGLILAALGSLLIYFTWTTLYFACFAPFTLVRAYREEKALTAEFGEEWQTYCKRVPAFIPSLRSIKNLANLKDKT